MTINIGIEQISFHIPQRYLALDTLAEQKGLDPNKFSRGIGQEKIAVPEHDEDIVTMSAEAAYPILQACGKEDIDTVLFATETGIDQSKSAGIYVHGLLDMLPTCRNVELKQACYGGTAALQLACAHVARKPNKKVLVIAADVSRYDLDSAAESTQGAGAVAMLISADPKVMAIEAVSGCHTEDIMDFWRPNYRKTPVVDGKYSTIKYLQALAHAWQDYRDNDGHEFSAFSQFCYHIPFTRMAEKGHKHLAKLNEAAMDAASFEPGLVYNRQIGNCYNASLYISIVSMLETNEDDLAGKKVGIFSYGSGASAEFFAAEVLPDYRSHLHITRHQALLDNRVSLSYQDYLTLWHVPDPQDGESHTIVAGSNKGRRFRLAGIDQHQRIYQKNS